jgi:hypothetical protein
MNVLSSMAEWLAMLVLIAGLVWAVVTWRSRHREAVLVAVACALLLAVNMLWLPGLRLLFGAITRDSYGAVGEQTGFVSLVQWLASGTAFGFLIFAALGGKKQ